ncbi:MAG: glucose 1-dehydrogenase [SAR202 cluster bacterium]|nr:glucose 1-dehydrogenase [SAR202 cluster bacterium]
MRLQDKVAIITGAANAVPGEMMGLGGATAWLFAREGARVVIGDINEKQGQRSVAALREDGHDALFVKLDVTREADWQAAVKATVAEFGKLNVLANNAGVGILGTVEETTEELWDAHMDTHAKGAFLGCKHAIPEMRRAGGGSIVNVSSIHGITGSPTLAAYHAAKGAVRIFTKAAAIQYARENIRVNSIHPGYVMTPMTEPGFSIPEVMQAVMGRIPMGRLGTPEEIAHGILYLASDESSYVTGSELVVDGGVTAQ